MCRISNTNIKNVTRLDEHCTFFLKKIQHSCNLFSTEFERFNNLPFLLYFDFQTVLLFAKHNLMYWNLCHNNRFNRMFEQFINEIDCRAEHSEFMVNCLNQYFKCCICLNPTTVLLTMLYRGKFVNQLFIFALQLTIVSHRKTSNFHAV